MADTESTTTLTANTGGQTELCARCKQLDLTIDKFIISNITNPADLSAAEKAEDPRKHSLRSGNNWNNFATYKQLSENQVSCPFCSLLSQAIKRYSSCSGPTGKAPDLDSIACSLVWEVDGRKLHSRSTSGSYSKSSGNETYVNATRRIRVSWQDNEGKPQEVYLVFVSPSNPQRPNSDAKSRWDRERHFLGRELGDRIEKHALVKSWLDMCVNDHSEVCTDTHDTEPEFHDLINESYFGVIDVADLQLKALPTPDGVPARYVALSYVWGKPPYIKEPYTTTRANIMMHILHGGLGSVWDQLPKTIQDAILFVSRLGERYLWVDSLCIVQDSDVSWQLNARAMHLVYGHAYFTICAADGDSSSGLRALASSQQHSESALAEAIRNSTLESSTTKANTHLREAGSVPISLDCTPDIRLMVTRPLNAVISNTAWNQRGWTFQERILSRRCLIFAEGKVYFQCRSTSTSQDIYASSDASGWSLERTNSPLRNLQELRQRPLWFYMKYVAMYTGRQLTNKGDILAAFEGVSWLLERYMRKPSLFGMPSSHFDLALLWAPVDVLKRRRPKSSLPDLCLKTCTQDDLGNCTCSFEKESFAGREFPSWAWSGWMDGKIEYDIHMIEGCLQNVHEWLKYHTWIQWHVRDKKGHIRPLWEISSQSSGREGVYNRSDRLNSYAKLGGIEDEARWEGYSFSGMGSRIRKEETSLTRPRRQHKSNLFGKIRETRFRTEDDDGRRQLADDRQIEREYRYRRAESPKPPPAWSTNAPAPIIINNNIYNVDDSASSDANSSIQRIRRNRKDQRERKGTRPATKARRGSSSDRTEPGASGPSRRRVITPPLRRASSIDRERQTAARGRASIYDENDSDIELDINRRKNRMEPAIDRVGNERYLETRSGYQRDNEVYSDEEEEEEVVVVERYLDDEKHVMTEDPWGRHVREGLPKERKFRAILPDYPFKVIREAAGPEAPEDLEHMSILQFFTWQTELHVTKQSPTTSSPSSAAAGQLPGGLARCNVTDRHGDWCGFVTLGKRWIKKRQGALFQFIAISDAKAFTKEECPIWSYYIPKEREESEWDLYYVLLIKRNEERGVWERVGLGKVFQAAFQKANWSEIKLG